MAASIKCRRCKNIFRRAYTKIGVQAKCPYCGCIFSVLAEDIVIIKKRARINIKRESDGGN